MCALPVSVSTFFWLKLFFGLLLQRLLRSCHILTLSLFVSFIKFFLFKRPSFSIEYKGLIHISPVTANTILKINKGDTFNTQKIDESIKALYNTGYFETIKAVKNGNTLIFECNEKPIILNIETGNLSEDLKKILKERNLLPKKGEIYSKEKYLILQLCCVKYHL